MKKYDFIRKQIEQVKEEIKERKQWKKAIEHEYTLVRTIKYNKQNELARMHTQANIMINHYENVLKELEDMLKEMIKIEGE